MLRPCWIPPRVPIALLCGVLAMVLSACGQKLKPPAQADDDAGAITFVRQVAPIVFEKCAPCHHPGNAAPFSLLTYDDVRRRAGQILEVTRSRFMPPWLPGQDDAVFDGARRLTNGERQILEQWVASGTLRGNEAHAPSMPVFDEGWQLGTPDLVVESPAYSLAADGADVFRNFIVPMDVKTPRWVRSIELQPVNP